MSSYDVSAMNEGLTLLVCGSRDIDDRASVRCAIDSVLSADKYHTLMHGGCRGVDVVCDDYTYMHRTVVRAQWDVYGKAAGPIRNQLMVDNADVVLAIFKDVSNMSPGTKSTCDYAMSVGRKLYVYDMARRMFCTNG